MSRIAPAQRRDLPPVVDLAIKHLQSQAQPIELASAPSGVRPSIADILAAAGEVMYLAVRDILSTRRGGDLVLARHVAMHVALRQFGHRLTAVGRGLERDQASVRYGALRIDGILHDDRVRFLLAAVAVRAASKCAERLARFVAAAQARPLQPKAPPVLVVDGKCKALAARRVLAAHPDWTTEQVMAATGLDHAAVEGARRRLARRRPSPGDVIAADFLAGRSIAEIAAARASTPGDVVRALRVRRIRSHHRGTQA